MYHLLVLLPLRSGNFSQQIKQTSCITVSSWDKRCQEKVDSLIQPRRQKCWFSVLPAHGKLFRLCVRRWSPSDVDSNPGRMVRKLQITRQGVFLFLVFKRDDGELQLYHRLSSMRLAPHSQWSCGGTAPYPPYLHLTKSLESHLKRAMETRRGNTENLSSPSSSWRYW